MRRESGKTEDCLKEERAHPQSEPQAGRSPSSRSPEDKPREDGRLALR